MQAASWVRREALPPMLNCPPPIRWEAAPDEGLPPPLADEPAGVVLPVVVLVPRLATEGCEPPPQPATSSPTAASMPMNRFTDIPLR